MLLSYCNGGNNRHNFCDSLPQKTAINPLLRTPLFFSFWDPLSESSKLCLKPPLRRTSWAFAASAAEDRKTLPQSAIQRIADKLRSLGYVEEDDTNKQKPGEEDSSNAGEIFVPLPAQLPIYRVGHTLDPSWSTPQNPVPAPGSGNAIQRFHELREGVVKETLERKSEGKRGTAPTLAELTLPKEELRRLRTSGIGLKKKLKVGKAGITEGIVNGIHERWRRSELVRIKCEDICRLNMKRTHDLLERKTGGLVIWRSGSNIILYRGANYKYPYFFTDNNLTNEDKVSPDAQIDGGSLGEMEVTSSGHGAAASARSDSNTQVSSSAVIQGVGLPNRVRFQLPGEAQLAEEADKLLEGLGPRFTDWWGYDPLPVDADLLPAIVPGYRRPFRLLPYGVRPKLTNDEMTTLRRLGRPLPCHFALGRNRKLQGLAAAIVKLWEKCEIAKIAIKRGVQNTNSEMMADELKWLTGGTLLSRDREFIVLYRGKDFLPAAVSSAIEERRKYGMDGTITRKDSGLSTLNAHEHKHGTMEDTPDNELDERNDQKKEIHSEQRKMKSTEAAIRRTSLKLSMALEKKGRAEKLLGELEKEEITQQPELDKEGISEEERYMLRKVGLRMKPFLLLGRRGVFDGTIENMHLHWKYRELVKVLMGRRSIEEVHETARMLEAESGGILVAVERVNKGYTIIIYRGKNYKRPDSLRPQTLLSKREAMKRSIEAQRRESLKLHILKLTRNVDDLKHQLTKYEGSDDLQSIKESTVKPVKEPHPNEVTFSEDQLYDTNSSTGHHSYIGDAGNEEGAMSTLQDSFHTAKTDLGVDFSQQSEEKRETALDFNESEPANESVSEETKGFSDINVADKITGPQYCLEEKVKISKSYLDFRKTTLEPLTIAGMETSGSPLRPKRLSNRERLILRKKALSMKKKPVLAIGKSNSVSGVAKAIKAHFQRYPLAIVNVKGRAKGTSVQEVVFKLEQATGAVLVSQEPSKVILYRGWERGEDLKLTTGKSTNDVKNNSEGEESEAPMVVPPELMSAIRLELGLQGTNEDRETPEDSENGSSE